MLVSSTTRDPLQPSGCSAWWSMSCIIGLGPTRSSGQWKAAPPSRRGASVGRNPEPDATGQFRHRSGAWCSVPCCSRRVGRWGQLSPGKARLEGPPEAYSELLLARATAARKREIATTMKQRWEVLLKLEQRFRVHPSLSRDHAASSWKDSGLRPVARPAASRGDG